MAVCEHVSLYGKGKCDYNGNPRVIKFTQSMYKIHDGTLFLGDYQVGLPLEELELA